MEPTEKKGVLGRLVLCCSFDASGTPVLHARASRRCRRFVSRWVGAGPAVGTNGGHERWETRRLRVSTAQNKSTRGSSAVKGHATRSRGPWEMARVVFLNEGSALRGPRWEPGGEAWRGWRSCLVSQHGGRRSPRWRAKLQAPGKSTGSLGRGSALLSKKGGGGWREAGGRPKDRMRNRETGRL